ncbi:HTTM domain-containing protein [Rhodothermus sp. AH-315-K08]|nr:HTTM domain-containing protein [Rhodothermus sp. AH-315-K08]
MPPVKEILTSLRARLFREAGRLRSRLSEPIDAAPLAYFRFIFGAILVWEVYRYFDHGWIARYYIHPQIFFTYPGFGWVSPWPGDWMYVHFIAVGILAAFVAIGLWYRVSAALLALGFCYIFLLDQSNYLNHFYLIGLLSILMAFIPANRFASVDAARNPGLRSRWVPTWSLWLIRFQIGVAYFFGGVAKLNGDWLRGRPMDDWLSGADEVPLIGEFLTSAGAPLAVSWGGLLLDLFIIPALIWKRTRVPAVMALIVFHLTNWAMFSIGIFPWFMLLATPIFFGTPWRWPARDLQHNKSSLAPISKAGYWLLAGFAAWQLLMPMRHHLYPGNVSWTEEGHRFAWHMKLRSKSGTVQFRVRDPDSGESWHIDPRTYLSSRQARKMRTRPYLILRFANKLKPILAEETGLPNLEIYARARISLNGRPRSDLIDRSVDLTKVNWGLAHSEWVLPLEEPLRRGD